jgi:hypothetical protein
MHEIRLGIAAHELALVATNGTLHHYLLALGLRFSSPVDSHTSMMRLISDSVYTRAVVELRYFGALME